MSSPILRCPECRTRRVDPHLMVLHRLTCERETCTCSGYHYKHRRGSTLCIHNPRAALRLARMQGASPEVIADLIAELAFEQRGELSTVCPF